MITPYGMSTAIGLATIDRSRMPLFLGAQGTPPADCTEEAAS
jgi:ATP-dependent Zn protease